MYTLKKSTHASLRESFEHQFKNDPEGFRRRITAQQVAVAVMCGDGFIARHHAQQPASAYIDTRVGGLPYSRGSIASATAVLVLMAQVAGLDPNNLPAYPDPVGLDTNDGYKNEAEEMARDILKEMIEEVVDDTIERGEVTNDPFSDIRGLERRFDETEGDASYGLADAVNLIDELSDYEEDDPGMWEGQDPEEAIITKAAFTFRNAVRHYIDATFSTLQGDDQIADILEGYNDLEQDNEDGSPNSAYESGVEEAKRRLTARITELLED